MRRQVIAWVLALPAPLLVAGAAPLDEPGWSSPGPTAGEDAAFSFAPAGDVNADGYADIVVGIPHGSGGLGRVEAFYGGPDGPSTERADWTAIGEAPADWFGYSVARAGDVDGDGFDDVLVAAVSAGRGSGRLYVYAGGPEGLSANPAWVANGDGGWYGFSIATAGDVDGDGRDEVIVGNPGASDILRNNYGHAWVYKVGAGSLLEQVWELDGSSLSSAIRQFGYSVSTAGDVNGDGFDDVIIGAPGLQMAGDFYPSAAFVVHGSAAGLAAYPSWSREVRNTQTQQAGFGASVASAGDMNGDGCGDVLVSAIQNGVDLHGRVYLIHGSAGGLQSREAWSSDGHGSYNWFGANLGETGDFNNDGFRDIVIGDNSGRAYVYRGSPDGPPVLPDETLDRSTLSSSFSWWIASGSAGDVNGDGGDDLLLGLTWYPEGNRSGPPASRAEVCYGTGFVGRLQQSRLDGSPFLMDGVTIEAGVRLDATVTAESGGEVHFEVRNVDAVPAEFSGVPTHRSGWTPAGGTATVQVTLPPGSWRWQARLQTPDWRLSPWFSHGRRPDDPAEADFRTRTNAPPAARSVEQRTGSAGAPIGLAGRIFDRDGASFVIAPVDLDGDAVRLEVEVRPVGRAFSSIATQASGLSLNGAALEAGAALSPGSYHWQWRVVDFWGASGSWISYGRNPESSADFEVVPDGSSSGSCHGSADPGGRAWPLLILTAAMLAGSAARAARTLRVGILLAACAVPARAQDEDVIPPASISDLRAEAGADFIVLSWTSTGDDGMSGTVLAMDVWASTAGPVSDFSDFGSPSMIDIVGEPAPSPAGTLQYMVIRDLIPGQAYWFGAWVWDEVWNSSSMTAERSVMAIPTGVDPDGPHPTPFPFPPGSPPPAGGTVGDSWTDSPGLPVGMMPHQCSFVAAGAHLYALSEQFSFGTSGHDARDRFLVYDHPRFHRFDPQTRAWQVLAPPDDGRFLGSTPISGSMTYAPGTNHVYLAAVGIVDRFKNPGWRDRLFRYDISQDRWQEMAPLPLPYERDHRGVSIGAAGNGKVYAIGGSSDNLSFYEFTPDDGIGRWTKMPGALPAPIYSSTTALAYPGSGPYLYGLPAYGDHFWRYDTRIDAWTSSATSPGVAAPMPDDGCFTLNKGEDGCLYSLSSANRLYRYDVAANEWSFLAPTPARIGAGCAVAHASPRDELLIARGCLGDLSAPVPTVDMWSYSIVEDRFTSAIAPLSAMSDTGSMVAVDGRDLYALCRNRDGEVHFRRYSIPGDEWVSLDPPPAASYHGYALAHAGGDFIHAFHRGSVDHSDRNRLFRYSIGGQNGEGQQAGTWMEMASLADQLSRPGDQLVAGGQGFLFLTCNETYPPRLYRYALTDANSAGQPADSWRQLGGSGSTSFFRSIACPGRGNLVYACLGVQNYGFLFAYSIETDEWTPLAGTGSPDDALDYLWGSTSLTGSGNDYLYSTSTAGSLWRYSISRNAWERRTSQPVSHVSSMVHAGGAFLYALQGGGSTRLLAYRMENLSPDPPSALSQGHPDGSPWIERGGLIDAFRVVPAVLLQATIADPDGDAVRLEVKAHDIGRPFDPSGAVQGPLRPGVSTDVVIFPGLSAGTSYQWRARAVDARGSASAWVPFGTEDAGEVDFINRGNGAPVVGALDQVDADSGESIPPGRDCYGGRVTLRARAVDPDRGDDVRLEVELRATGADFTGRPTAAVGPASSGSVLSLAIEPSPGAYEWRCRAVDPYGLAGPWMNFAGNSGGTVDFRMQAVGSTSGTACLGNAPGRAGAPAWIVFAVASLIVGPVRRRGGNPFRSSLIPVEAP